MQRNYAKVTELKRRFPGLKILLSVGGGRDGTYDDDRKVAKYLELVSALLKTILYEKYQVISYNINRCFTDKNVYRKNRKVSSVLK